MSDSNLWRIPKWRKQVKEDQKTFKSVFNYDSGHFMKVSLPRLKFLDRVVEDER